MKKNKLIEARKLKGLSQNFLAEKLCVTVSNYNRREKGQTKISANEWRKLANELEVPLEDIYEAEDFYFFDDKLDLVYRGQMDDSRPGNNKEITGEDLIIAFENLLAGEPQEEIQRPSMGCNIKWK